MSKRDEMLRQHGGNIAETVALRPRGSGSVLGAIEEYLTATAPATAAPATERPLGTVVKASRMLPIDAIDVAAQVRADFDEEELRGLADSLGKYGQLAPIRVRPSAEHPARWVVLVGERRLRACRLLGLTEIHAVVVQRALGEADVLAEQLVENEVRAALKPTEQARAMKRLMELEGWTAQDLARTLGIKPTNVYRALGLNRLAEDVAEQVDAGVIKPTAAYEISRLEDRAAQRELARRVAEQKLDHAATVEAVAEYSQGLPRSSSGAAPSPSQGHAPGKAKAQGKVKGKTKGKAQPPVDDRPRRMSNGVKITIEAAARHTRDDVVAALEELIQRLRQPSQAA